MESRIEQLVEKYWEGETSLREEEELRYYFSQNPSLTPTGMYFRQLDKEQQAPMKKFAHPGKRINRAWLSIAATISLGVLVGLIVLRDAGKKNDFEIEDPQQAYEITRKALMMMSSSLNEGQVYSGELKKLNKAEEIVKEQTL